VKASDMRDVCWVYDGHIDRNGYGRWGKKLVHRLVYEALVESIPEGLTLDHVAARGCTSKACYNPRHLEPVPNEVNSSRMWATRQRATHCTYGHEYTEDNVYWASSKTQPDYRQCRQCNRDRAREWYRANKAKTDRRFVP
jgi:hypothetical protein